MTPATKTRWGIRLRAVTAAVCYAAFIADATGHLIYWPSGRGETRFERVGHVLLCGGGLLIGTFFAVVAAAMAARSPAQQSDPDQNHCAVCGYDLRATPERCPECGAAAERPAA